MWWRSSNGCTFVLARLDRGIARFLSRPKAFVLVKNPPSAKNEPGWRSTLRVWAGITAAICLTNCALLTWITRGKSSRQPVLVSENNVDSISVYQGSCTNVTKLKTWSHLAINVLSTLLLVASANFMQCLSSPAREEIDKSHANGRHVDIGLLSARNLQKISRSRFYIWICLAITSVPLHSFYNSVFTASTTTYEMPTFLISDLVSNSTILNFMDRKPLSAPSSISNALSSYWSPYWNAVVGDWNGTENTLHMLLPPDTLINFPDQIIGKDTTRAYLTASECIATFNTSFVPQFKSLMLILNGTKTGIGDVLDMTIVRRVGHAQPWTCDLPDRQDQLTNSTKLVYSCKCGVGEATSQCPSINEETISPFNVTLNDDMEFSGISDMLTGCTAEPAPELCTFEASSVLLGIVVASNLIKLMAMSLTLWGLQFQPVVTVGDAIREFLVHPDPYTSGTGPISARELQREELVGFKDDQIQRCLDDRYRGNLWRSSVRAYFEAVSTWRWIISIGACISLEIIATVFLKAALEVGTLHQSMLAGFGALSTTFFFSMQDSVLATSLVSNLPQLIVSTIYVLFSALLSAMFIVTETSDFASQRKAVRVSPPRQGSQRSTYWLTAPYRYALPLMFASIALHWLLSQSIFLVRVNQITVEGEFRHSVIHGCGYSPIAILATMLWGGFITVVPLFFGFFRLPAGMPIMGHNSLAIAAACHADLRDPPDVAERPLMYGVLPTRGGSGRRRVGFSSLDVEPLEDGEIYEQHRCVAGIKFPTAHVCSEMEDDHYTRISVSTQKLPVSRLQQVLSDSTLHNNMTAVSLV